MDVYLRYHRRRNKYKGDLKVDISIMVLKMTDYDVSSLHIPYGPLARKASRIEKSINQTVCLFFCPRLWSSL